MRRVEAVSPRKETTNDGFKQDGAEDGTNVDLWFGWQKMGCSS